MTRIVAALTPRSASRAATPIARSGGGEAVIDGNIHVVIGGRIFLPGGGITLGGDSGTNAVQVYRPTMGCV